jgi:hypothetical protein
VLEAHDTRAKRPLQGRFPSLTFATKPHPKKGLLSTKKQSAQRPESGTKPRAAASCVDQGWLNPSGCPDRTRVRVFMAWRPEMAGANPRRHRVNSPLQTRHWVWPRP